MEIKNQQAEHGNGLKNFFIVALPILFWLFFSSLLFILMPRMILGRFLVWWLVIIFFIVSFIIFGAITLILYYYLGFFNLNILQKQDTQVVKELDPKSLRKYVQDYFRDDLVNPVNLEVCDFTFSGIRSVGTEKKTEIFIDKFRDKGFGKLVYYYIGVRVHDISKIYFESRKYNPNQEEEESLVRKVANNLAESPEKLSVTETRVTKTPFGDETVKFERIPIESHKQQTNYLGDDEL